MFNVDNMIPISNAMQSGYPMSRKDPSQRSLKTQLIHHVHFENEREAEHALFNYIEVYYNRKRKHSTGDEAPAIYEQEWWDGRQVA